MSLPRRWWDILSILIEAHKVSHRSCDLSRLTMVSVGMGTFYQASNTSQGLLIIKVTINALTTFDDRGLDGMTLRINGFDDACFAHGLGNTGSVGHGYCSSALRPLTRRSKCRRLALFMPDASIKD